MAYRRAPFEVLFQASMRSLVKGNETAFAELGAANHQTVYGDVLETEMDCFRHTKPGARQQGEKGVVGVPAKGVAFTQRSGGLENALDLLPGKDVGHRSRPVLTAEDWGRYFVV
jgi:hypothetical protein